MLGDDLEQRLARFRRLPRPVRVVYARPRTFIGLVVGIAVFFLAPASLRPVTRFLIGWDAFTGLYLMLVYAMMLSSEHWHVRLRAALRPRILSRAQARRPAISERRHPGSRRLLGLRVFLLRHRHDRPGLR